MISLKDIAEQVGISVSAVSMALKDSRSISLETKRRVWEAQRLLGYKTPLQPPPGISAEVGAKRSNSLDIACLLIDREFENPTYASGFQKMAEKIIERHWRPIYLSATVKDLEKGRIPPLLRNGRIDGMVVTGNYTALAHQHLRKLGIPMTISGRYRLGEEPWIACEPDFGQGIRLFLKHLIGLKHQRFGLCASGGSNDYEHHLVRHYLYEINDMGLESAGIADAEVAGERLTLRELLARKPTAILTSSYTAEFFSECAEGGIRVPDDLSVAIMGSPGLEHPTTKPTLIAPCTTISSRAVELLAQLIENPGTPPCRELIPMRLIPGETVAICKDYPATQA